MKGLHEHHCNVLSNYSRAHKEKLEALLYATVSWSLVQLFTAVQQLVPGKVEKQSGFQWRKTSSLCGQPSHAEVLQTGMNQLQRNIMEKKPLRKNPLPPPPSFSICSSIYVPFYVQWEKQSESVLTTDGELAAVLLLVCVCVSKSWWKRSRCDCVPWCTFLEDVSTFNTSKYRSFKSHMYRSWICL